ncbi:hypothetical protein V2O64_08890 [Verrucomicrobiaceae bacterium 227]
MNILFKTFLIFSLSQSAMGQKVSTYDSFAKAMAKIGLAAPLAATKGDVILTKSGGFSGQVTMFFRSKSRDITLVCRAFPPTKNRKDWAVLVLGDEKPPNINFEALSQFPIEAYRVVPQTADDGLVVTICRWNLEKQVMTNIILSELEGIEENDLYKECVDVINNLKFPKKL